MQKILQHGLSPELVSHVAAAAGGPKWLMIGRLEQYLFGHWLAQSDQSVKLIGSSAGAWCMACAAQADPGAALQRFEQVYLTQRYDDKPTAAQVNAECERLLSAILGERGVTQILANERYQLNVVTMRCHGAMTSDHRPTLLRGLTRMIVENYLSRRRLRKVGERVIFHVPDGAVAYEDDGIPTSYITAGQLNLRDALMASGMIPLVMLSVRDIHGAPKGMYRDGGLIDYHMDLPLSDVSEGIVLLPHFQSMVYPGWFDKIVPWRRPRHLANTLLITPSESLIEGLPGGRIPSRKDFQIYARRDDARIHAWKQSLESAQRMADEWAELAETGRLVGRLEPL